MTVPLTWTLEAMDELVREAHVPADRNDAVELFDIVHTVTDDLGGLHDDLAECLSPLDATGRCTDCGRLVARAHNRRGCAMAIPVVGQVLRLLDGGAYSLPFVGKALWLAKRRRVLAAAPPPPARPVPPRGERRGQP
jgi:hypothetical protein